MTVLARRFWQVTLPVSPTTSMPYDLDVSFEISLDPNSTRPTESEPVH